MVAVTGAADSTGGSGVDNDKQRCNTKADEVHSNQTTKLYCEPRQGKTNRSDCEVSDENVAEVM